MDRIFKETTPKEVKKALEEQYKAEDAQFGTASVDKVFLPLGRNTINAPVVVHKINLIHQINSNTYAIDVTQSKAIRRTEPKMMDDKRCDYEHSCEHEQMKLARTNQRELSIFTLSKDSKDRLIVTPTKITKPLPSNSNLVLRNIGGSLLLLSLSQESEKIAMHAEFYKPTPEGFNLVAKQAINDTKIADIDFIPIPEVPNQFLLWTAKFTNAFRSGLMTLKVCELTSTGFKELQTLIKEEKIAAVMDTNHPFSYTKPNISEDNIINCQDRNYIFVQEKWIDAGAEVSLEHDDDTEHNSLGL